MFLKVSIFHWTYTVLLSHGGLCMCWGKLMKEERERENALTCPYVPDLVNILSQVILLTTLLGIHYYPHVVQEENIAQREQITCPCLPIDEFLSYNLNLTIKLSSTGHHEVSQLSNCCSGNFCLQLK